MSQWPIGESVVTSVEIHSQGTATVVISYLKISYESWFKELLVLFRILKSDHNQKGVFYGEDDRERCKQMFTQMETIMEKVDFSPDVGGAYSMCEMSSLFLSNFALK